MLFHMRILRLTCSHLATAPPLVHTTCWVLIPVPAILASLHPTCTQSKSLRHHLWQLMAPIRSHYVVRTDLPRLLYPVKLLTASMISSALVWIRHHLAFLNSAKLVIAKCKHSVGANTTPSEAGSNFSAPRTALVSGDFANNFAYRQAFSPCFAGCFAAPAFFAVPF